MCLVLIQYGADVHQQDGDGDTPLMLAEGTDLKQTMMSEQTNKIKQHCMFYWCTSYMVKYESSFCLVAAQNRREGSVPRVFERTSNDHSPSNAVANSNQAADSVSNEDIHSSSCNEEAPGDDESNKPAVSRQGTFSKEGEREDGDEDTVPRSRYMYV